MDRRGQEIREHFLSHKRQKILHHSLKNNPTFSSEVIILVRNKI